MFQLDGETIIGVLRRRKTNGTLSAGVSPQSMVGMLKIKEPGVVTMIFQKGEIVACRLATSAGRVCTEDLRELTRLLAQAGVLHWSLELSTTLEWPVQTRQTTSSYPTVQPPTPAQAPAPRPAAPPPLPTPLSWQSIPSRLREVQVDLIQDMTLRRVYQLVDGQRSIEKVSALSRLPVDAVMLAVQQLQRWGLVGMQERE